MYDTKRDILDALSGTPEVLGRVVAGLLAGGHATAASPDAWSAVEIVCHLRDAEERALERTRMMLGADNPRITPYDPAAWAIERQYASQDLEAALLAFRALRETHAGELVAIPFQDWHRGGEHEEYGHIDILGHALHIMSHDAVHLRQLARLVG